MFHVEHLETILREANVSFERSTPISNSAYYPQIGKNKPDSKEFVILTMENVDNTFVYLLGQTIESIIKQ